MRNIKYILVNDSGSKSRACYSSHRFIPHIGQCIEVKAPGFNSGFSGQNARFREQLLDELVRLRSHFPNAKILGVSELDVREVRSRNIVVSEAMNVLRRELSDLP